MGNICADHFAVVAADLNQITRVRDISLFQTIGSNLHHNCQELTTSPPVVDLFVAFQGDDPSVVLISWAFMAGFP